MDTAIPTTLNPVESDADPKADPKKMLDIISSFLDGFEVVPPDSQPFITLDNQRRFYLNASLRKFIGIKAYDRVALLYRHDKKEIAVLSEDAAQVIDAPLYNVDKRHYMSARRFCADYGYDVGQAPYTFEYVKGESTGGVFIFRLKSVQ